MKLAWVAQEAIRQTRLLQSCRSCAIHSLESSQNTKVDLGECEEEESEDGSAKGELQDFMHNCSHHPGSPAESVCSKNELDSHQPTTAFFDVTFDDYESSPLSLQDSWNTLLGTHSFIVCGVPLVSNSLFQ